MAKYGCEYFSDGIIFTEDFGYEPSEPPSCSIKGIFGRNIGDTKSIPCKGCTSYKSKAVNNIADFSENECDIPF